MNRPSPWIGYACGAINLAAGIVLAVWLRPGTEAEPDPARRMEYIATHAVLWRFGWGLWMAAGLSLLLFFLWWKRQIFPTKAALPIDLPIFLAVTGLAIDWSAEVLYLLLPSIAQEGSDFPHSVQNIASMLSGLYANGCYCLCGLLLSGVSWHTGKLHGRLGKLGTLMWLVGLSLSLFVAIGFVPGMIAATAGVMALFCPWVILATRHLCHQG